MTSPELLYDEEGERALLPHMGNICWQKNIQTKKAKKAAKYYVWRDTCWSPWCREKEVDKMFNFIQRIAHTLQRRLYKNTNCRECRLLGDGQAGPGMVKYLNAAAADWGQRSDKIRVHDLRAHSTLFTRMNMDKAPPPQPPSSGTPSPVSDSVTASVATSSLLASGGSASPSVASRQGPPPRVR